MTDTKATKRFNVCSWCGKEAALDHLCTGRNEDGLWEHEACKEEREALIRKRNEPIIPPVKEGGSTTWKVVCRFCGSEDCGSEVLILSDTVRDLVGFMNCNGCGKGQRLGQPQILEIVETEEGRVS